MPHYSALLKGEEPSYPAHANWAGNLPAQLGMMMNDSLGDCTCAGVYHAEQVWTENAGGNLVTYPDSSVEQLYQAACGYVPGNPATDQGGNEQDVLTYCLNAGFPTPGGPKKIAAFLEVDPRNLADVCATIWECGVSYIGFDVPQYLMAGTPPAVWDVNASADNTIIGGHCVILAGYDTAAKTFQLISWGQVYTMTWAFFSQFTDESYAIADADWIQATGHSPAGLSLSDLEAQMSALRA